ncbi:hypothetical protein H6G97_46520 [Nostoc flagelliforme FACHB-838]|uniref:Uncharacterized protein n=1 Tax=Nostoc flagelliforme FACHB-838 TaxID=2692904 RepID=A0ABR8E4G7_9NOSO|nr:hypothetical protein [Nostoc flagelliforme]MBD2536348.1 hypothetical protein [Nostoc flagelliforme FACHB-838]
MKLYAKTIPKTLPDWATTARRSGNLFEIEINAQHPDFQSLLEELGTEIEPGTIGVKAKDLCSRLGFDLSNPNMHPLIEQAQTLISEIAANTNYKQLLEKGYQPDLNIANASTALTYLQWELDQNRETSI